jgi:hypothetical protein
MAAGNRWGPWQLSNDGEALTLDRSGQQLKVAPEITAGIFEGLGARSTTAALGFGRFWRNVRTLHDPVAYKRREVGAFLLRDELPEPTWYS